MKKGSNLLRFIVQIICITVFAFSTQDTLGQDNKPYVRIARIVVDSTHLDSYKAALKEHAEAAVSKEPGVLTLYAVYDKDQATQVTVFEIYANMPAYEFHIQTPHFLKYKNTVKDMVKSLVLTDVVPIALETKPRR
jgi:quinol monooxygenase YgiN